MLIHTEKNLYFTLSRNGMLSPISDLRYRNQWFRKIDLINDILDEAHNNEKAVLLFRGEDKIMYGQKTCPYFYQGMDPYYDRFFVIGSKAKSYLRQIGTTPESIKQFDSVQKCNYIFRTLQSFATRGLINGVPDIFLDTNGLAAFQEKIDRINNPQKKLTIENFFLAFIHTFSSNPTYIGANSVLISSTQSLEKAIDFARGGFVIVFWLAGKIQNQAIDYQNIGYYCDLLEAHGLPRLDNVHYPDELEVTVFSAIFPHNIVCVYNCENRHLVFNPYIYRTNVDQITEQGIQVDQRTFSNKLRGIYERSIWKSGEQLIGERHE